MNQERVWDIEYGKHSVKWKKERLDLPKMLKGKRVLEVGVGNGKNLADILRQNPKSVTAIDFSSAAVNACKKQFPHSILKVKKMNLLKTSFKRESFDVILCYYVLDNMTEIERKTAVKEMHRILAKKGQLFVEDFAVGDLRQDSDLVEVVENNTLLRKNGLICHFFTVAELRDLFKEFRKLNILQKSFPVIRDKPKLKRKLVGLVAEK